MEKEHDSEEENPTNEREPVANVQVNDNKESDSSDKSQPATDTESWETLSADDSGEEIGPQHNKNGPCRCDMCLSLMMAHSARVLERSTHADITFPDTVTKIETEEGSLVYVVGTAHFSEQSQTEVAEAIQALCPDMVFVELCKSRTSVLHYDEETLLREAKDVGIAKLKQAIKQSGVVSGVMQMLLLSMSAHLTKELGMAPGGEFRRAVQEARKIPGCDVRLCDRPVEVTLARAMGALSPWQKIKLGWHMITSRDSISKEDVERYKQKDMLAQMLAEMTGDFPALTNVFITERDMYMANILRRSSQPVPVVDDNGDVVAMEKAVIVAVVGIGHMEGIAKHFNSDINVKELMTVPKKSKFATMLRYAFRTSLVVALSWSVYKIASWTKGYWN